MLYPIELLGQMTGTAPNGVATDGVHVNGRGEFCHVVLQLFGRKPLPRLANNRWQPADLPLSSCKMHQRERPSLHIAMSHVLDINITNCFKRILLKIVAGTMAAVFILIKPVPQVNTGEYP